MWLSEYWLYCQIQMPMLQIYCEIQTTPQKQSCLGGALSLTKSKEKYPRGKQKTLSECESDDTN